MPEGIIPIKPVGTRKINTGAEPIQKLGPEGARSLNKQIHSTLEPPPEFQSIPPKEVPQEAIDKAESMAADIAFDSTAFGKANRAKENILDQAQSVERIVGGADPSDREGLEDFKPFQQWRTKMMERTDPHLGIDETSYDFQGLYQDIDSQEEIGVHPDSGKLILPDKHRIKDEEGNFRLPAFKPLDDSALDKMMNDEDFAGRRALISRISEKGFDPESLGPEQKQALLREDREFLTRMQDIKSGQYPSNLLDDLMGGFEDVGQDVEDAGEFVSEVGLGTVQKVGSRIQERVKAGGDLLRDIPIGEFPDGSPATLQEVFRVFGVDELIQIPNVEVSELGQWADLTSEFLAIGATFAILKGTGAPGVVVPLTASEALSADIESNLANLVKDLNPGIQSEVLDALAVDNDDTTFDKLKKFLVVDIGMTNAAVMSILGTVKILKNGGFRVAEVAGEFNVVRVVGGKVLKAGQDFADKAKAFNERLGEVGSIQIGPGGKPAIDTPEFKEFFEGSKIVDEAGEPLTVFHGTASDFEAFDPERTLGGQVWFTDNKAAIEAGEVGASGKGVIKEAFISLKNPAGWDEYDKFSTDELIGQGFDGLKLTDPDGTSTYVAFDVNQIQLINKKGGVFRAVKGEDGSIQLGPEGKGGEKKKGVPFKGKKGKEGKKATDQRPSLVTLFKEGKIKQEDTNVLNFIGNKMKGREKDLKFSVNWNQIQEPPVRVFVKGVREEFGDEITKDIPSMTNEQAVKLAETRIKTNGDQWFKTFMTRDWENVPPNSVDAVMGNFFRDDAAFNLYKLGFEVQQQVPGSKEAFAKQLARFIHVEAQRQKMSVGAGRSLQAMGIPPSELFTDGQLLRSYEDYAKRILEGVTDSGGDVDMLARKLTELNIEELSVAAKSALRPGKLDAVLEWWTNALLSGFQTHAANFSSNLGFLALNQLEDIGAAAVGKLRGVPASERIAGNELIARSFGMMQGMKDAWAITATHMNSFWKTMDIDPKYGDFDKTERLHLNAIKGENFFKTDDQGNYLSILGKAFGNVVDSAGKVIRIPTVALVAGDEIFKSMGYRTALHGIASRRVSGMMEDGIVEFSQKMAIREAAEEGITDPAAKAAFIKKRAAAIIQDGGNQARKDEYRRLIENPPQDLDMAAMDEATYLTFQKPLGEAGQSLVRAINTAKYWRFVFPFMKTPINIMKAVVERSPLALARFFSPDQVKMIMKGGPEADRIVSRMALGTSMVGLAMSYASEGRVTGSFPRAQGMDKALRNLGQQPNSIRFGNRWVSLQRLDPVGTLMIMGANFANVWDYLTPKEKQDGISALYKVVSEGILSKTWMKGFGDLVLADRFGDPWSYLGRQGASFIIPRAVSQFQPAVSEAKGESPRKARAVEDPTVGEDAPFPVIWRKAELIWRNAMKRVPHFADDPDISRPLRNRWGEVAPWQGSLGPDIFSPIWQTIEVSDPLELEILKNGVKRGYISDKINGVGLKTREIDNLEKLAGPKLKKDLEKLVKSQRFQKAPIGPESIVPEGSTNGRPVQSRGEMISQRIDLSYRQSKAAFLNSKEGERVKLKIEEKEETGGNEVPEFIKKLEERQTDLEFGGFNP